MLNIFEGAGLTRKYGILDSSDLTSVKLEVAGLGYSGLYGVNVSSQEYE